MLKYTKTLLALAGATVMLSALVSTATANRLSTSNPNIRVTWSGIEFVEPVGGVTRCAVTLEGSLHSRTIAKVRYTLTGFISRAVVAGSTCVGGAATILQASLPWHIKYESFRGTLPNITAIEALATRASFRIQGNFGTCLFTTTDAQHAKGTYNRNTATGSITSMDVGPSTITSNEGCGPFGSRVDGVIRGRSTSITLLGAATLITVTLI